LQKALACGRRRAGRLNVIAMPGTWQLYLEHEPALHTAGAWVMIGVGTIVLITELCGMVAPYGRHGKANSSWFGPLINAKVAWVIQESGAFLVPVALLRVGEPHCLDSWTNRLLLSMFMVHYFQRSFIYPPLMRGGKPMPIGICFLALAFCVFNGWLQGRLWTSLEVREAPTTAVDAACLGLGCSLWAAGFAINLHADAVLRGLRKIPGDTTYYVPRGGAFEYVSAANYFGEFVEWCGYALAARHIAACAFAYFTFCNLAPRAKQHHEWYQKKIEGYPTYRMAMLPFVW